MSKKQRESMIFYRSFYDCINTLKQPQQLNLYKAIFSYVFEGVMPDIPKAETAIFSLIKPQLDANAKKWENGCKGGAFGKQGGRPTKNPKKTPNEPQQNALGVKSKNPDKTPNVNDNENVNENENDNENEVLRTNERKQDNNKNLQCARERESYEDIITDMEVSEIVRPALSGFIKHCQLNGRMLTNDKLTHILVKLDMIYHNDLDKAAALQKAVNGGYFDIL